MFEREIRYITDFTLNSIKKLGSFFTLGSLSSAKIHPAIMQYISAELDYLIFLDRQRLLQKSLFDYSGPEISRHFSAIAGEIKKNKLIPFEDARRLVQQAVTFNVNYLLRPRWSLKHFVYDGEEYRSAEEMRLLLNYSWFFDYYKHTFFRYIEKKNFPSMSINEFVEKVNIITQELLNNQYDAIVGASLDDIASFFNMGDAQKTRLPIEVIEVFLRDRHLENLIPKVRQALSADMKQKFELDEYKKIILGDDRQLRIFDFDSYPEPEEDEEETKTEAAETTKPEPEIELSVDIDKFFQDLPSEDYVPDSESVAEQIAEAAPEAVAESVPTFTEQVVPAEEHAEPGDAGEVYADILSQPLVMQDEISGAALPEPVEPENMPIDEVGDGGEIEGTLDTMLSERLLDEIRMANDTPDDADDAASAPEEQPGTKTVDENPPAEKSPLGISDYDKKLDEYNQELSEFEEEILSISLPDDSPEPEVISGGEDLLASLAIPAEDVEIEIEDEDEIEDFDSDKEIDLQDIAEFQETSDVADNAEEFILEDEPELPDLPDESALFSEARILDDDEEIEEGPEIELPDEKELFGDKLPTQPEEPAEVVVNAGEEEVEQADEETETELFNFFTTKETMRIVSTVFKNDSIDFVNTIERLATCPSPEDAQLILKSVFFAYHVDPVIDKEARMLEERVQMFFSR
ncbi:MAG: hypothetical protein LWX56_04540 [Ignavibacteria bacterium]|nr:hypothetical protein [Ignavibacteria bacterium]